MVPKRLIWEEHHYFGFSYLVQLTDDGISLQKSTGCIPFTDESYCLIKPTEKQWTRFYESLLLLNLDPTSPEDSKCDGFDVSCHIEFEGLRVRFEIVNPDFLGFEILSDLVNQLTFCEDHPKGLLLNSDLD